MSTPAFWINDGNCSQGVISGGQITILSAIPSSSIRTNAAASWSAGDEQNRTAPELSGVATQARAAQQIADWDVSL